MKELQDRITKRALSKNAEETERLNKINFKSKRTDRWAAKKPSGVAFAQDGLSNSSISGRSNNQKDNNYF